MQPCPVERNFANEWIHCAPVGQATDSGQPVFVRYALIGFCMLFLLQYVIARTLSERFSQRPATRPRPVAF